LKKHPVVYFSAIVTGLCLLVLAAVWLFPNSFNRWDADFSDHLFQTRYQLQGIQDTSVDIVHVDLNDETLNDPLFQSESRDFLAKVVQRLGEAGAKAIVFDIFFNGKSTQNALIDVSKQLSSVYYPIVLRLEDNAPNTLLSASQRLNPIKGLTQAAKGLGHISMQQDSDIIP
jgi:CHASE2 domain-containing sensor protein